MYIKYFTSDLFNKSEFVKLLRYTMNVEAAQVEDGIILDIDAFNAVSKALMPHWAFINSKFINSKLHTRPASKEEYKATRVKIEAEILELEEKIRSKKKAETNPLNNVYFLEKIKNLYNILNDDTVSMDTKKKYTREIVEKIVYNKAENSFMLYLHGL